MCSAAASSATTSSSASPLWSAQRPTSPPRASRAAFARTPPPIRRRSRRAAWSCPAPRLNAAQENLSYVGTMRGRVGYLVTPTLLLHATAGFAYDGVNAWGVRHTRTGWAAGAGAEWMFVPSWSAKFEYLYADLSGGDVSTGSSWNYGAKLPSADQHPAQRGELPLRLVRAGSGHRKILTGGAAFGAQGSTGSCACRASSPGLAARRGRGNHATFVRLGLIAGPA